MADVEEEEATPAAAAAPAEDAPVEAERAPAGAEAPAPAVEAATAAIEAPPTEDEKHAAMKIQAVHRGRMTREKLKKDRWGHREEHAAIKIQAAHRGKMARIKQKFALTEKPRRFAVHAKTPGGKEAVSHAAAYRDRLAAARQGIVRQTEYPDMPSPELIEEVFAECDVDRDERLSEREMLRFVRCLDYPDDDIAWAKEFKALCNFHQWDPEEGIDLKSFVTIVDDTTDNYNCDTETLEAVIDELRCMTPSTNANMSDLDAPGHLGMDDMSAEDAETQVEVFEVPVTIKFDGLQFDLLMAIDGLKERVASSIRSEISRWLGIDTSAIGSILLSLGSVVATTNIATSSIEEAKAVQQYLSVAAGLKDKLAAAVRNTPGIQAAVTGQVQVVEITFADPTPFSRGRSRTSEDFDSGRESGSGRERNRSSGRSQSPEKEHLSSDEGSTRASFWDERSLASYWDEAQGTYRPDSSSPIRTAFFAGQLQTGSNLQTWPRRRRIKSRSCLERFKVELLKREQSLAGAWRRCLDPKWRGRLARSEFLQACRQLNYRDNMQQLWHDLDINSHGYITLAELAWEECVMLGEFYDLILREYGGCNAAAKSWGMVGPKRFHLDDWLNLCMKRRLCGGRRAADKLFRLLCSCPLHGVGPAFQGNLGSELADKAPAVNSKALAWLSKIGPTCKRPAHNRVVPGSLGKSSSTLSVGQVPLPKEQQLPGQTPRTLDFDSAISSADDWGDEDYDTDAASVKSSESSNSRYMQLYSHALEYHKRRTEMAEQQPEEPVYDRERPTQELYDRLYGQAWEKRERMQQRAYAVEEEARRDANKPVAGRTTQDPKSLGRLLAPQKKQETSWEHVSVWSKPQLWPSLKIDELMVEADRIAEEIAMKQLKKYEEGAVEADSEPILQWRSFGKTRTQILDFLQAADKMNKKLSAEKAEEKKLPEAHARLYEDAKQVKEKWQQRLEARKSQEAVAEQERWKCDMHLDEPCEKCHLCNRWKARMEGRTPCPLTRERMIDLARCKSASDKLNWEDMFADLLVDADRLGLLAHRNLKECKLAFKQCFSGDQRWEGVTGRNRDRLLKEAMDSYEKRRVEAEKRADRIQKNDNPETYFRLYLDANTRQVKQDEKAMKCVAEQRQLMQDTSIHQSEGDPDVFGRLHRNDKKESRENPIDELNELAGLPPDTPWKHRVWQEPESQCISCGQDVTSGYKTAPLVSFRKGAHICDICIETSMARDEEPHDLVGKRVWVSWRGNYWFRAFVEKKNDDDTFLVIYEDDGKCDFAVPREFIKVPEEKHSKYAPGYRPRHVSRRKRTDEDSSTSLSPRRSTRSVRPQDQLAAQVLRFVFPDAPWPPPTYFKSEFLYSLEMLGARRLERSRLRFKKASENGGIIGELGTTEDKLQMIRRLPLGDLAVMDHVVSEVWCQDPEEDPLADFADWVGSSFSSLEEAFEALTANSDQARGRRTLTRTEFLKITDRLGFDGDARFVFHALDTGTGLVCLADFDQLRPYLSFKAAVLAREFPQARNLQAIFALPRSSEHFGLRLEFAQLVNGLFPDFRSAFMHLDRNRRGAISFTEFSSGVESLGWSKDSRMLFRELDYTRSGYISMQEWEEGLSKVMAIAQTEEQDPEEDQEQEEQASPSQAQQPKGGGKGLRPAKGIGRGKRRQFAASRDVHEEMRRGVQSISHGSLQAQTQVAAEGQIMQASASQSSVVPMTELSVTAFPIQNQPEVEPSTELAGPKSAAKSKFRRAVKINAISRQMATTGARSGSRSPSRDPQSQRVANEPRNTWRTGGQAVVAMQRARQRAALQIPVVDEARRSESPAGSSLDSPSRATAKAKAKAKAVWSRPQPGDFTQPFVSLDTPEPDLPHQIRAKAKARLNKARVAVRLVQQKAASSHSPERTAAFSQEDDALAVEDSQQPANTSGKKKGVFWLARAFSRGKGSKKESQPPRLDRQRTQPNLFTVDSMLPPEEECPELERPKESEPQPTSPKASSLKQRARTTFISTLAGQRIATLGSHLRDGGAQHSPEATSSGHNARTPSSPVETGMEIVLDDPLREFTEALLESYQDLETAFQMMDLSGSGRISLSEFRAACKSVGYSGDATEIFRLIDTRGNRVVGKRDFAQLFRYVEELQLLSLRSPRSPSQPHQTLKRGKSDQEVTRHILEQQWAKKPTVAKANVVTKFQQKANTR